MEALKRVDVALPTYDDEAVLWGDPSPEATVERMQAFGIAEIVVKNGPNGALVATGGQGEFIPVPEVVVPVDTTAAGDSFNAGYLAARLTGKQAGRGHRRRPPARRRGHPAPRRHHAARRDGDALSLPALTRQRRSADASRASSAMRSNFPAPIMDRGATHEPPTATTLGSAR